MRLSYLRSSSVVVEDEGTAVLRDPWLVDGAFYGSWCHYPPLDFEPEAYAGVDYVYLSGAAPNRFHSATMARLDADTPVLIHDDAPDRLRRGVEELGFDVTELARGERTHLGGDLHVTVVGADGHAGDSDRRWWQACSMAPAVADSSPAGSMAAFDDGENVLVDAGNCRWPLSRRSCDAVAERYDSVDLLLVQCTEPNPFPQRMEGYSHEEKLRAREAVIGESYEAAEGIVDALDPAYFLPIAGSYVLAGDLAALNRYVASPTRSEAFWHFVGGVSGRSDPVLLNSGASFDLDDGTPSEEYTPIDRTRRQEYVEGALADRSFPYQHDDHPSLAELTELLGPAYDRLEAERRAIGWESDTTVLLNLVDGRVAALSMAGDGYEVTTPRAADTAGGAVRFSMDDRLLARILRGEARFDHAQIGSHVEIRQRPTAGDQPLSAIVSALRA
mgnify:FL=1